MSPILGKKFCKPVRYAFNERGSTIVMVTIGVAVICSLSLVYLKSYNQIRNIHARVNALNTISQLQLTITNTANDANSWQATYGDGTHNSAMGCLPNSCPAVSSTPFTLWPAGHGSSSPLSYAVVNGVTAGAGFTSTGQACTGFSTAGNPSCPIQIQLAWSTAGCSGSPCSVTVTATVLYRPGSSSSQPTLNELNLAFNFQQTSTLNSVPCSGVAPAALVSSCAVSPPYPDHVYCTSTGYQCGQVYF